MGFADLAASTGLYVLEGWMVTRSYVVGYSPSQADVTVYKALKSAPDSAQYPNAARWYKQIASHQSEFESLPGDKSTDITQYGPDTMPTTANLAEDDDDEVDLFGSDDEDEDAEKAALTAKRLEEYNKKKAAKPKTIAKSVVTLDVKPWDDETDMNELVANVKAIEKDGLVWGAHTLVPVGFGIKKLQINLVVEDEKVSLDELQQQIEEDEDHVQSTDVAAMQKL